MSEAGSNGNVADEILQLTQEALNLANAAVHFDNQEIHGGAYDYYDKCILNIDEIMSKLPPGSEQWRKLMHLRVTYDERMEVLKEIEANRNSFFGRSSNDLPRSTTGSSNSGKFSFSKKKVLHADDLSFTEIDIAAQFTCEAPPTSMTEVPYWTLRNIRSSIVRGGFLCEGCFVPKAVWTQTENVKFTGITAKTAAFEILLRIVNSIEDLPLSPHDQSLSQVEAALLSAQDELLAMQNQLSKPFPYIKEVLVSPSAATAGSSSGFGVFGFGEDGFNSAEHSSHNNNSDAAPGHSEDSPAGATSNRDSMSTVSSSKTSTKNRTFTSFVSNLSKNVRKYAEVGFHRLAVALPSKLSSEELSEYTALVVRACDKAQLFANWFRLMIEVRASITQTLEQQLEHNDSSSAVPSFSTPLSPPSCSATASLALQGKADSILQALVVISGIVRDVYCEILLRDVEYLLDKYLAKTRKSYSRMYWDQEHSAESSSS